MTKMTKRDWFVALATVVENSNMANKDGALEFINHEIELLNKKSSRTTMTATQKANLETMETIKTILGEKENPVTIKELMADERLADLSNQKISSLLTKLKDSGVVVRTEDKKKAFFSLA